MRAVFGLSFDQAILIGLCNEHRMGRHGYLRYLCHIMGMIMDKSSNWNHMCNTILIINSS